MIHFRNASRPFSQAQSGTRRDLPASNRRRLALCLREKQFNEAVAEGQKAVRLDNSQRAAYFVVGTAYVGLRTTGNSGLVVS